MIQSIRIKDSCIGCKGCQNICPSHFRVEKKSEVISQDFSNEQSIFEAERNCPVQAIVVSTNTGERVEEKVSVRLQKKRKLTENVYEFSFEVENFSYLPGQFVSFFFQDEKGSFIRSYSIVTATTQSFVLCIKLLKDGRGSSILQNIEEGTKLQCSPPKGMFILQNTATEKVFIATGTGLAPIIAMLQNSPASITKIVIFGLQREEDIFYKDILESIPNTKVIITLSRASEQWEGYRGRVTDYISSLSKEAEIYMCGNPAMVESVQEELEKQEHPSEKIFHEIFSQAQEIPQQKTNFDFLSFGLSSIQRILLLLSVCIPLTWFFPEKWGLLWDISWYSVFFLMLIRPMVDIFPKATFLRRLIPLRKELGILSASVVVISGIFTYLPHMNTFFQDYFSLQHWTLSNFNFFAHMGELTGLILLITSNSWSQRLLKSFWKKIQNLSYIYFFSGGIYIFHLGKTFALYSMILVGITWFLARKKVVLWQ